MMSGNELLDQVCELQNSLIADATGGTFEGGDGRYRELRKLLLSDTRLSSAIPDFLRRCRDTGQFWGFIKFEFGSYAERRNYIWNAFHPILDILEGTAEGPAVAPVTEALVTLNSDTVLDAWHKALGRRESDPEGAITAARSLLESTCKHILDDLGIEYSLNTDLPKLWAMCADELNLSPKQHDETTFKSILGNCQSVVNTLATLRNRIGDAHGTGRRAVKPAPRHAELAVNLAGSMAAFLVSTWAARRE